MTPIKLSRGDERFLAEIGATAEEPLELVPPTTDREKLWHACAVRWCIEASDQAARTAQEVQRAEREARRAERWKRAALVLVSLIAIAVVLSGGFVIGVRPLQDL